MSLVLKKIDRTELVRQLSLCLKMEHKTSAVAIPRRNGPVEAVVKVAQTENGIFLYSFERNSPLIEMAPMMGSSMHEYNIKELIDALNNCQDERVWLQWPDDNPSTVVGKVFAIGCGDRMDAWLVPVPKDIGEINEDVRVRCAEKCEHARNGRQCGDCELVATCEISREVGEKIVSEREGDPCES